MEDNPIVMPTTHAPRLPDDIKLQVVDLPPVPEGHRRAILVSSNMNRAQWNCFKMVMIASGLGPAAMLLLQPAPDAGESIAFDMEDPVSMTAEHVMDRATKFGFSGLCVVEADEASVVIGYESGPSQAAAEVFAHLYPVMGVPLTMRQRRQ